VANSVPFAGTLANTSFDAKKIAIMTAMRFIILVMGVIFYD
jgi:hypothetical protein